MRLGSRHFNSVGAAVGLGGGLIAIGSVLEWATFSRVGSLQVLVDASGISLGHGVITLLAGIALGVVGVKASRSGGQTTFRGSAVVLSTFALVTVLFAAAFLTLRPAGMYWEYGGESFGLGIYAVGIGAVVALIASMRLTPIASTDPLLAKRRRLAGFVVLGAVALWWIGQPWLSTDQAVSPLVLAAVMLAVGVGHLPGRLPFTRVRPALLGVALLAYVAFALLQPVGLAVTLLRLAPVALVLGVAGSAILDLPPRGPEGPNGATARAAPVGTPDRSRLALLGLALGLTIVVVVLEVRWLVAHLAAATPGSESSQLLAAPSWQLGVAMVVTASLLVAIAHWLAHWSAWRGHSPTGGTY